MLALIDTGASRSLLRRDVAKLVLNGMGRPAVFKRAECVLTSLTGHGIEIVGELELIVQPVGLVKFLVVKEMSQACIIGIDQLNRHGYTLSGKKFTWGRAEYIPLTPGRHAMW